MRLIEKLEAAKEIYRMWKFSAPPGGTPDTDFTTWVDGMACSERAAEIIRRLPRNVDYSGGYILLSPGTGTFYKIAWGTGDNLTKEDEANGYDAYIIYEVYRLDGDRPVDDVVVSVLTDGCGEFLDGIDGLEEEDGGMNLLRVKDGKGGDLRKYIPETFMNDLRADAVLVNRFD